MTALNGHQATVPILLISESDRLVAQLQAHLGHTEFQLHTTTTFSDLTEQADLKAVILGHSKLLEHIEPGVHPYPIVLVHDEPTFEPRLLDCVDAIVPSQPVYIIAQLRSLVQMYARNAMLSRQVDALQAELEIYQRTTDEMEVLKNAIVRNVSHELRTPLLQVKSAVAMMAEDIQDKTLANYAENATARLEALVKNITMLGASLDIKSGPLILRDAIDYARRNLARTWQRRIAADRVQVALDQDLPPILADKQGLSTVLQQLMDNALKFSDPDSPVLLSAKRNGDMICIAVRDEGIGIAKDQLDTIFDSFYQVDSSSTRRYGGAGVGLALVKLILDLHGVSIKVESQLGKGSTFWFELPVVNLDDELFDVQDS